jgi:hypothetical protein
MKKILMAMAIAATLVAISATAEENRFAERLALDKEVPHEVAELNKGTEYSGANLIVRFNPTDEQVVKLVKWYVSVGYGQVFIYDSMNSYARRNKDNGVGLIAWYDGKTLMRSGKTEKQDHEIPIGK